MIVQASRTNQLGNSLLNHSHLMVAAWEAGTRFVNPCFGQYADLFPRLRDDPLCGGFPRLLPRGAVERARSQAARVAVGLGKRALVREATGRRVPGVRAIQSGWESTEVDPSSLVHVDSEPFQAMARSARILFALGPLFRHADNQRFFAHRERIAEVFAMAPDVVAAGRRAVEQARRRDGRVVGVHIRRGDYAYFLDGCYYYDWSVYERLMADIVDGWGSGDVSFLVVGDESPPAEFAPGLPWTRGPGDVATDLESLSRCDMIIGPPSTFSKWAAFTGGVPRCVVRSADAEPVAEAFVLVKG